MNPNETFGSLHPWQEDLIKLLTEGFDEPAQPMYLPLPARDTDRESVRARFLAAAEALNGKNGVKIWVDDMLKAGHDVHDMGADSIIYLDSCTQLLEWKVKVSQPMPTLISIRDEFAAVCRDIVLNETKPKAHVLMNDWRKNRGGRKNR